jgi:hypothetical protein
VQIHTERNPVQIDTSSHCNLIGHCVAELSTGTTLPYIFLVTTYNLRRTQDMCLKLSNFKTVPLLMSHFRYKVLHSKSQGEMHSILCKNTKARLLKSGDCNLTGMGAFHQLHPGSIPCKVHDARRC